MSKKKKILIALAILLGLFVLWLSFVLINRKPLPVGGGESITAEELYRRIKERRKVGDE